MTVHAVLALTLFTHTNLVNVNGNIGILIFLNMAPLQYLVFTPQCPNSKQVKSITLLVIVYAVFMYYCVEKCTDGNVLKGV